MSRRAADHEACGSTVWSGGLSERDPGFPKDPRLPMLLCAGFAPAEAEDPPSGVAGRVEDVAQGAAEAGHGRDRQREGPRKGRALRDGDVRGA
jgi:hypothetical protein